jgi:hypothetical protein
MLLSRQSDIRRMLAKISPTFLLASVAFVNVPQPCSAQSSMYPTFGAASLPRDPLWVGLGAGLITFFLVLIWARKLRKRSPMVVAAASVAAPATAVPEPSTPKVPRTDVRKERPIAGLKPRNGVPVTSLKLKGGRVKSVNGSQRKRSFDYNRYFGDLMSSVYSQTFSVENTHINGRFTEPPATSANGNGHDSTNGVNGLDLISSQKSLIEEQRRLIQEQSKLIEEKTRLIAEKNHVLKIQSEFIESKVL